MGKKIIRNPEAMLELGNSIADLLEKLQKLSENNSEGEEYFLKMNLGYDDKIHYEVINSEGETEIDETNFEKFLDKLTYLTKKEFVKATLEDLNPDDLSDEQFEKMYEILKK